MQPWKRSTVDMVEKIRRRLEGYRATDMIHHTGRFTPSAVLMPLFNEDGRLHVLFTKRTLTLKYHKGQISFPGGALDPSDESCLDCALRETHEEIGLPPEQVEVLGRLDETPVVSNYRITPFVGLIPHPFPFKPNEEEIDRLIVVPLDDFMNPDIHRMVVNEFLGQLLPIHFYDVAGESIWGATARILTNFLEVCFDYRAPLYARFLEELDELPRL